MTTGQKELPAGWKWVKLGDVSESIRGVTFKSQDSSKEPQGGYVACITTSAVQTKPDWSTARYIPVNAVRKNQQMLQYGDILVSTANSKALVGKSCMVDELPFDCAFGAFVTVIRPSIGIEHLWLANYLITDAARGFFYKKSSATTNISNLKTTDLLNLQIPLPPLEEQEQIVDRLNGAEEIKKTNAASDQKIEELKSSLLQMAFRGEL